MASKPGIPYKMYFSRALSAWGDRMWDFGGGLFMMGLHYDDLRLVAIYGFARCFTVIVFGAAIGNWIDRTERLSSTRVFLALQVVYIQHVTVNNPDYLTSSQPRISWSPWTASFLLHSFMIIIGSTAYLATRRQQSTSFQRSSSP